MGVIMYSDTILVPVSLFLMVGYHAYLWHSIKTRPSVTTIGSDALKRKSWFIALYAGDDKKAMLAIQSLRNTLMITILTATIAVLVTLAVGALTNNAFTARDLFSSPFFGSTSPKITALKYGAASLFLVASFLCSSLALGFLIDANYLINASSPAGLGPDSSDGCPYSLTVFENGFVLAIFGNRLLCLTFPMLMWMFGPVPVVLSSSALVWVLYELDFTKTPSGITKHSPTD
ncbi:uncharacterized protein LOC116206914 [Punica granatum]|uniref:PGG domain-containing protein n=2 Tax=Punica granatum TaxID=22663 RepID=A0A218W3E3_PUNGR|nr:uncharacterized protein LOC116206914 [Punica granatum]OWM67049.1 hypothetical protein CDL15_Pgr000501 [Punica granatum]PKI37991.1 hypothetical protein CRG98_041587 [Punica granatum]